MWNINTNAIPEFKGVLLGLNPHDKKFFLKPKRLLWEVLPKLKKGKKIAYRK